MPLKPGEERNSQDSLRLNTSILKEFQRFYVNKLSLPGKAEKKIKKKRFRC